VSKNKSLISQIVPKSIKSPEYEQERNNYQLYCERVHRGLWKPSKVHSYICNRLEAVERGLVKRLMIFMPPRHGKSQTVTETFPSWYLGRNPDKRIIEVSYSIHFAEKFGRLNRRKIEDFGKPIFGIELSSDQASKTNWTLTGRVGGMISTGIGGSVTGEGSDLMIIDDPIKNRQEAESATYRRKLWEEWQDTLLTRLHPNAAVIFIMTRWREDDLAGMILQQAEQAGEHWEILRLPCIAEEGTSDVLGRRPGQALWPEHGYDEAWAAKKKATSPARTWNALYQQNPIPAEGNIIKQKWWRFYDVLPAKFDLIAQSWDMSFKGNASNDFVVGQIWGILQNKKYLIDRIKEKMDFPTTLRALKHMYKKWPKTRAILIEDKANGSGIIDSIKNEIPGVIPILPDGSKEARCWAAAVDIEAGDVLLPNPENSPWVNDFIEEYTRFPNAKNDDQVDAGNQLINWARTKQAKKRNWKAVKNIGNNYH